MTANEHVFDAAIAAWNAGDLAGYLRLYDERIRLHGYAPVALDKTGVTGFCRDVVAGLTAPGRQGPRLDVHERFAVDDRIVCRFTMSGAHAGLFMGVPATGLPYAIDGITVLRFAGGRCVERWSQADLLGLMTQIGAIRRPAAA